MGGQIDIRSWKVFRSLDSALMANIRMAMVVGKKLNSRTSYANLHVRKIEAVLICRGSR